MKKILLVGMSKFCYMPYSKFYIDQLLKMNLEIHLLLWDRDDMPDEELPNTIVSHKFKYLIQDEVFKVKKLKGFLLYRKYTSELLEKGEYDNIIVLLSLTGVLILDILRKKYNKSYILDYRDYTYEHHYLYKKMVWSLVKNSALTFVSSDAFRTVLPDDFDIITTHNIRSEEWAYRSTYDRQNRSGPLRIGFWGIIRHEAANRKIINNFAGDSRFEIHFYGREQKTALNLRRYCEKNKIANVFFHGAYMPNDRLNFGKEVDILHNMYENDRQMSKAMGNKYYDGLLFYLPQLCTKGSFMGELVETNKIGLSCDYNSSDLANNVFRYFHSIKWGDFYRSCDIEGDRIMKEYQLGIQRIKQIFE